MPMELKDKDGAGSDDEEDLEKLRLAALQSLKRPAPVTNVFKKCRRNYGRNRNGQFRVKSANLISIPTIDDVVQRDEIKLVLPQDRYCGKKNSEEKPESTSKFDRYDKSESESEYESESGSENCPSPTKLERANSLEALMQELENEIQGNSQPRPKKKLKKRKKKPEELVETKIVETKENENDKPTENKVISPKLNFFRKQSPLNRTVRRNYPKPRNTSYQNQQYPSPINYPAPPTYHPCTLYNPIPYVPAPEVRCPRPTYFDRPLSPLALNTDDALTIARAPLSPRSAAFVLQNRDAIERRKKSPRRSYSRSPSPSRYHRSKSKSPKFLESRSRTPLKDERRSTPSKEARKRSPVVRRRSVDRKSPDNGAKKKLVRDRLGNKKKRSKSLSPAPPPKTSKLDDELRLDPVLEARKRKFETNEIKNKEGIIRLKPKQQEEEKANDEVTEPEDKSSAEPVPESPDDLDETLEDFLNAKVDDIFSDEDTDEENEGRFKNAAAAANDNKRRSVAIVPFGKPLGGKGKSEVPKSGTKNVTRERSSVHRSKPERKEILVAPIENKKIEIKIRNPSKYETTSKYDVANKNEANRKVEVSLARKSDDEPDLEAKISLDTEDEEFSFGQKSNSGDLRAQLSRKRAERQSRLPAMENVPSRLLQNALQGAVFKKQKKAKAENESVPKDAKVPIHLRLGITNADAHQETKTKKPGKSKGRTEQV